MSKDKRKKGPKYQEQHKNKYGYIPGSKQSTEEQHKFTSSRSNNYYKNKRK